MIKQLTGASDMEIKTAVAQRYGEVAVDPMGHFNFPVGRHFAESVGYSLEMLDKLPPSFWQSFTGAGNPHPFIKIAPDEKVLDLGCGAGLDLYLYAQAAGPSGKVFGLDLSSEMIHKAQQNMAALKMANTTFLWAAADDIPLPDNSLDIVTANGIYNLSPNKEAVMREVFRILKPGGRTIFSEIVLTSELPGRTRENINDWFRCIGGALTETNFLHELRNCKFSDPKILWKGRNARTGHALARCAVIQAEKGGESYDGPI